MSLLLSGALLAQLFTTARTIAVVGAKDKPGPADTVGRYLISAGYTVVPVHPARATVWGLPAYKTLADVPLPIDIIDLFRAPEHCPGHAREALALAHRPGCFWMQQGIASAQAEDILRGSGTMVVFDHCLMVEHQRIMAR